jgi:HSP20 family protein
MENLFERPLWKPNGEKTWMPVVDIFEKVDKSVVKAKLLGMKEEDINVSVAGDSLTIKDEKKTENEVKDEDYYCCDRTYGSFHRSIPLPSTVDPSKIEANIEDGVPEVTLPKFAEVKPKKIAVSAKKKANKAAK